MGLVDSFSKYGALALLVALCMCPGSNALDLKSDEHGRAELPQLTYRYAVFYAPDPNAAAQFLTQFVNATLLSNEGDSNWLATFRPTQHSRAYGGHSQVVSAGLRLPYGKGAYSDVYFVNDPTLPAGSYPPSKFAARLAATHSMANDDWDWWQDWHLAFTVDSIDAVALKLMQADVPFVSRGSLYFTIPGTGVTIQVLGSPTIYWTESFLFCRKTDNEMTGKMKPYPLNVTDISVMPRDSPIPQFIPGHQSIAASDAKACAAWAYKYLNVAKVEASTGPSGSHAYAGGICADIEWMEISKGGWEIHWIQQFNKREGYVNVKEHEDAVSQLHAETLATGEVDAYANYRVGFSVSTLQPYIDIFSTNDEPFTVSEDGQRMLVYAPNGYTFELFEESAAKSEPFNYTASESAIVSGLHE